MVRGSGVGVGAGVGGGGGVQYSIPTAKQITLNHTILFV